MGENINIRTVKDMKAYLDAKIDKLASSESISGIKALVQEQSNLILKLTAEADLGLLQHPRWSLCDNS